MPLSQCVALTLERSTLRQQQVLEGYCFNLPRGKTRVRDMIVTDIGSFSDLGALRHVSDLSEVLKQFDQAHPSAPAAS